MNPTDYPILLIYSEEDHSWLGRVDQLPGLIVDGETPSEALANAREAIQTFVATYQEMGRPVPEPLSVQRFEELQAQVMAKQQELFQNTLRAAVDDISQRMKQASHLSRTYFAVDPVASTEGTRHSAGVLPDIRLAKA